VVTEERQKVEGRRQKCFVVMERKKWCYLVLPDLGSGLWVLGEWVGGSRSSSLRADFSGGIGGTEQFLRVGGQFTGLGSFFHPTGAQTQGVGPDLLVKLNFAFRFVW